MGDVYAAVGTWGPGKVAQLSEPFAVAIDLDALLPPAQNNDTPGTAFS